MKIQGGPEELATFLRCLGGEQTLWLDPAPACSAARPPIKRGAWNELAIISVLAAAIIGLALLAHGRLPVYIG